MRIKQFFKYAQERYQIKLCRDAGDPWPWTADPVLQRFRFCHIFREDDRTTQWFKHHIRDPIGYSPVKTVLATAGFRWFTYIPVGEKIGPTLVRLGWSTQMIKRLLGKWEGQMVTGAYMVTGPIGMNKLDGICCAMDILKASSVPRSLYGMNLEEAHTALMTIPYLGDFRAYEIVTDLRHTIVLKEADDIMTWANPGPGALQGCQWVNPGTQHNYKGKMGREMAIELMRKLLFEANHKSKNWPSDWPQWEMREVEHTLCEYGKYQRGCHGERLKRRFTLAS